MIVINKNKQNIVSTDITNYNDTIVLLRNIMSGDYISILVSEWNDISKRSQSFILVEANVSDSFTIYSYPLDQLNSIDVKMFNVVDTISMNLDEGQYDVWSFYSPYNDVNDINFRLYLKDNIDYITSLTTSDDFSLYLKYNATTLLVK